MTSKYLIVEVHSGLELPIVFNPILKHDSVANGLPVKSAGFCRLLDGVWHCWGKSESLNKVSRLTDAAVLNHDLQMDL